MDAEVIVKLSKDLKSTVGTLDREEARYEPGANTGGNFAEKASQSEIG